jgi:hypothetical protein
MIHNRVAEKLTVDVDFALGSLHHVVTAADCKDPRAKSASTINHCENLESEVDC